MLHADILSYLVKAKGKIRHDLEILLSYIFTLHPQSEIHVSL